MADLRDKTIRPCPDTAAGIERLGLVGYLREQFELWRGTWSEWECGENDEDLTGAWGDGDMEQAEFFAALLGALEGKVVVDEAKLREFIDEALDNAAKVWSEEHRSTSVQGYRDQYRAIYLEMLARFGLGEKEQEVPR